MSAARRLYEGGVRPPEDATYHWSAEGEDRSEVQQEVEELLNGTATEPPNPAWAEQRIRAVHGHEDDVKLMRLLAVCRIHQGDLQQAKFILAILAQRRTLSRLDRAAVLSNLGVVAFREGAYLDAYRCAAAAMKADKALIAPWLVAAASLGQLDNEELLRIFARAFRGAFGDLSAFPQVGARLVDDRELSAFTRFYLRMYPDGIPQVMSCSTDDRGPSSGVLDDLEPESPTEEAAMKKSPLPTTRRPSLPS